MKKTVIIVILISIIVIFGLFVALYKVSFTSDAKSINKYNPIIPLINSQADFFIKQNPNDPDAYALNGHHKALIGNYKEAFNAFEQALNLDPNNLEAYFMRGNVKYHLKDYDGAREDYKRCIELNGCRDKQYFIVGYMSTFRNYIEANEAYNMVLEIINNM